ncbi:conserved hypothetical protein [Prosthecochloris aestuarii DSM 271]|uniref:Lipoprotein n=1 Tax=Prosthecochloris aestuarii (strain DSM 271 / SK 413) TaxID=290512 RepID=B4S419_PROA2|nr:LptE family protein [Prosthecochloris aestuarii]ACF46811.1 conserved hypothetical protein [Prosthecochloris aestuarii DSM 271]
MVRRSLFPLLFLCMFMMHGCYSFSGSSVPAHINTVAIPLFGDTSGAGVAQLTIKLTDMVHRKVEGESRLQIEPNRDRADAVLEGVIVSYNDEASQLSSETERASTNRITLVVKAVFRDRLEDKELFPTTSFTGFADYSAGSYAGQQEAIRSSVEQISDDIFNAMVSIW